MLQNLWTVIIVAAVALAGLTWNASAETAPPPSMGTADRPELEDPENDVAYDPRYTGSKDHSFLDITAAWFSFNNTTREIVLTMRIAGPPPASPTGPNVNLSCGLKGNLTQDGQTGRMLAFDWWFAANGTSGSVAEVQDPNAVFENDGHLGLDHGFWLEPGNPTLFHWSLPLDAVLLHANEIVAPTAGCVEWQRVEPIFPITTVYENADRAQTSAAYSFLEQRPRSSGDDIDDAGDFETGNLQSEPASPRQEQTPGGFGLGGPVIALIIVGAARRRLA